MSRISNKSRAVRSRRVVTPEGVRPATVWLLDGIIERVASYDEAPIDGTLEDFGDAVISPGVIDAHVHINEPGRADWEGFETATRAAAAGGLTMLAEMPLNASPVVTTLAAWHQKIAATKDKIRVDCGFYGGLVPGNVDEIEPMLDAGALGIKAFLVHSGLDEFPAAGETELRAAMPILARRGVPLLVHAEIEGETGQTPPALPSRRYADYLASRPANWELRAIRLMIGLCREFNCPVHIVHLATAQALPELKAARAEGLPLTVETSPHYLFFDAEAIPDGATQFKCAPPIRDAANREGLWQGLRDGTIDFVASDHSPCPPALKNLDSGNFAGAWGGIASLQWMLPIVWSGARLRGVSLEDVTRWTSGGPAKLLRLENQKGVLKEGLDADLVVWEPETSFMVTAENNFHRHKVTPYNGVELMGATRATFVRGEKVYADGEFASQITGQVVRK
ncbi:allantoinase [Abditibacteriota bacterium]|nr:allantoinase [Abditibacteriota bacterium]